MIRRLFLISLLTAALWQTTEPTWAAPTKYVLDPAASTLRFEGRSTLHGFTGTTHTLRGSLTFDPAQRQLLAPAEVSVPIAEIDTGNDARNHAMQHMFDMERYPDVQFTLTQMTPLTPADPQAVGEQHEDRYRLEGRLRIRQIEQPVTFEAHATDASDTLTVTGEVPLTTTMFELKPPSVLGLVRVRKEVLVQFTSVWRPQP